MGAGGDAPPVKSENVMILIGSSILLIMLIIQAWSIPTIIPEDEDFQVKYDLAEGDIFYLTVTEGIVRPEVIQPSGYVEVSDKNVDGKWEYTAEEDGVHTFSIVPIEESEIQYDVSRGILFDYILYPIGFAILSFGLWKKNANKPDEAIEAVLED